jgi:hypothetical protein
MAQNNSAQAVWSSLVTYLHPLLSLLVYCKTVDLSLWRHRTWHYISLILSLRLLVVVAVVVLRVPPNMPHLVLKQLRLMLILAPRSMNKEKRSPL